MGTKQKRAQNSIAPPRRLRLDKSLIQIAKEKAAMTEI